MDDVTQQSILNKTSEDKFALVLNLPPILAGINTTGKSDVRAVNLDKLQFSIEGSVVPPITVPSIDIPFAGQNLAITSLSREAYPKNRVRFTIDNRFTNYWVLWKWLNVLNDAKRSLYNQEKLTTTKGLDNLHNYQTDISVFGLDEYNNKTVEFIYHKAFITSLGGIEYDFQKSGQISTYFEYAYSQFHMNLL